MAKCNQLTPLPFKGLVFFFKFTYLVTVHFCYTQGFIANCLRDVNQKLSVWYYLLQLIITCMPTMLAKQLLFLLASLHLCFQSVCMSVHIKTQNLFARNRYNVAGMCYGATYK